MNKRQFSQPSEIFTDVGNDGWKRERKSEIIIIRQNIIFSKDFRQTKYFICDMFTLISQSESSFFFDGEENGKSWIVVVVILLGCLSKKYENMREIIIKVGINLNNKICEILITTST